MRDDRRSTVRGRPAAIVGAIVAATVCVALGTGPGATRAGAATSRPGPIRILAPRDGSVVRAQRLMVRVRARGSRFRARLDGRDVSGRFDRGRGGVRTATFKRARDFKLGANALRIEVGDGASRRSASTEFQALVPAPGRMHVRRLAPRADRAPIELRMHVAGKIAGMRLWVNGRRARGALSRNGDAHRLTAGLGAYDGVRYGSNRVVAEVRYRDHRISRTRRVLWVSRRRPLGGAGPDRRGVPGRRVSLDGAWTKPARRGARLLYRWTVVGKPAGSKVGVAHARSRRGSLRADVPGVYRVRLTVAEVAAGAHRGARAGRAAASSAGPGEASGEPLCVASPGEPTTPALPVAPAESTTPALPVAAARESTSPPPAPRRESTSPPLPLTPPGETSPPSPLAPPPCVTPTLEEHPPPLPAAAPAVADELRVKVVPTADPIGETVQTLAADGSIRIGDRAPYARAGSFAHLLVLDEQTLQPAAGAWGPGNQGVGVGEAGALLEKVEKAAGSHNLVIVNGNGSGQATQTASLAGVIGKVVTALGGALPSGAESRETVLAQAAAGGDWSIIGTLGEPGRTYQNLRGLNGTGPPGVSEPSLPGGLNGYLQIVSGNAYDFVSSEIVPIDTRAQGSTENQNVFEVGGQTFTSAYVPNGELAVHLLVLPTDGSGGLTSAGGQITPLDQGTYVIDKPYNQTNQGSWNAAEQRGEGVIGLAYALERWRKHGPDDLIVMQTFGENGIANYTAPGASPNWVNDALIRPTRKGLFEWHEGPYVPAGSGGLAAAEVKLWNPGYPTVAGQVGALTGSVGHDLVANFGGGVNSDNHNGYAVTRLSMVANNHPADPALNYVKGSGPDTGGPTAAPTGRLVGTLTRTHQAQWTVQASAASPALGSSALWQLAFQAPTAWPDSGTPQFAAAMRYIARQLWPSGEVTDVRAAYVEKASDIEGETAREIERIDFQPGLGFGEAEFDALRSQLVTEVGDIVKVKGIVGQWQQILSDAKFSGYVDVQGIAAEIEENAIENANERRATTELDPTGILSEALYIGADLLGPETGGISDGVAVAAGALGLADAISPPEGTEAPPGPDPTLIRDHADELAGDLASRFDIASSTLDHLTDIFMADWGKLRAAAAGARGPWAFGTRVSETVKQALAVSTAASFYEAMLPLSYRQWVIAPYVTDTNGTGPNRPANDYQCIHYRSAVEGNQIQKPFRGEPAGAMAWVNYRPWEAPGSTTPPAQPYTQNYTVRALKSRNDPLTMREVKGINENEGSAGLTIEEWGADPPAAMIDDLFEPLDPGEADVLLPQDLGINKVEFYARYGGGLDWARVICAQYDG